MPRDKLDVLRYLAHKQDSRRQRHTSATGGDSLNSLPRYESKMFKRKYYFREEDLV